MNERQLIIQGKMKDVQVSNLTEELSWVCTKSYICIMVNINENYLNKI